MDDKKSVNLQNNLDKGNYNEQIEGDYINGNVNNITNYISPDLSMKQMNLEKLQKWKAKEPAPQKMLPFFLDEWANWEVRIILETHGLGIQCDDKDLGNFRVFIFDLEVQEIVYMIGKNDSKNPKLKVVFNRKNFSDHLLLNIFHLARCWREHKRSKKDCYADGFEYFRNKVIIELENS